MSRPAVLMTGALVLLLGVGAGAQMTPWFQWTLLPKDQMAEIVGETSGENAYHMIMETGGYDKDRTPEEFATLFYETKFYLDTVKSYGFADAQLVTFPGGTSWDAIKGELWEVTPIRQKLASYRDMAAMLATGSMTGAATGELVWVGAGRASHVSSSRTFFTLDFHAKSNRSPPMGIAPTSVSMPTLSAIRARTGPGAPSRTPTRMIQVERIALTRSPMPGTIPTIGSMPIRQDVPGISIASSRRRATSRALSRAAGSRGGRTSGRSGSAIR